MYTKTLILILAAIAVSGIIIFLTFYQDQTQTDPLPNGGLFASEDQTQNEDQDSMIINKYGTTTLEIGQRGVYESLSIQPLAILEDSRCPLDVECIHAGTIKVQLQIVSGLGTSTQTLSQGEFITTEAEKITFVEAIPSVVSTETLAAENYELSFIVEEREMKSEPLEVSVPQDKAKCFVGGCSSQICSDSPDRVSTCEYRESYACYKSATCEVQQDGQCGWTMDASLSACLRQTSETYELQVQ